MKVLKSYLVKLENKLSNYPHDFGFPISNYPYDYCVWSFTFRGTLDNNIGQNGSIYETC